MMQLARAGPAVPAILLGASLVLTGCPPRWAEVLVPHPPDTATPADPRLPRDRVLFALVPDSANARIRRLAGAADLDAVDIRFRSGECERFRRVDERSIAVRRDSLVFAAGGRARAVPLSGVSGFVLRDRPPLGRRLALTGLVAAVGAGLAVLPPSSRSSGGEAAESAAIGAAVALPFGVLLGRTDSFRRSFLVSGFDVP